MKATTNAAEKITAARWNGDSRQVWDSGEQIVQVSMGQIPRIASLGRQSVTV